METEAEKENKRLTALVERETERRKRIEAQLEQAEGTPAASALRIRLYYADKREDDALHRLFNHLLKN